MFTEYAKHPVVYKVVIENVCLCVQKNQEKTQAQDLKSERQNVNISNMNNTSSPKFMEYN